MKSRKIEVLKYNLEWPKQYLEEIELIKKILSLEIIETHHIGSTAVPNLVAKPIIDILLEVKDVKLLDKYNREMVKLGYTPKGEFGIPNRRFYLRTCLKSFKRWQYLNNYSIKMFLYET
jgi:GrpB-like predicted nucleotidyltransferase (UPF0157 family)